MAAHERSGEGVRCNVARGVTYTELRRGAVVMFLTRILRLRWVAIEGNACCIGGPVRDRRATRRLWGNLPANRPPPGRADIVVLLGTASKQHQQREVEVQHRVATMTCYQLHQVAPGPLAKVMFQKQYSRDNSRCYAILAMSTTGYRRFIRAQSCRPYAI